MVIPIPDNISDKVAAMFEPMSVGLHAVLRQPPEDGDHVLVIAGGMIAYTIIAAIRMLGIDCQITQLSLLDFQKKVGENLGVNHGLTNKQDLNAYPIQGATNQSLVTVYFLVDSMQFTTVLEAKYISVAIHPFILHVSY